jgi:tripartite-type tricarboxylate transporter receptor subunit TctC
MRTYAIAGFHVLAVIAGSGVGIAHAQQSYPLRPVRLIVPFTPGAINDLIARLLAARLAEGWRQQVVVDNRPGAGTVIGTDLVAKATPDGHTLLLVSAAFAINPALYARLPFDPVRDFAPITLIGAAPFVMVVAPGLPVRSVKELVTLAKSKPGQLSYASTGIGATAHLVGEMLKTAAGIDLVHIPYKGFTPALTDVIAGQVQVTYGTYSTLAPHIQAGRVRALAVTSAKRSQVTPDLPTVAEAGYPNFNATAWWGMVAPARVPAEIVRQLHRDISAIMQQPAMRDRLAREGVDVAASNGPREFADFIREEIRRWGAAVKQSGAQPE